MQFLRRTVDRNGVVVSRREDYQNSRKRSEEEGVRGVQGVQGVQGVWSSGVQEIRVIVMRNRLPRHCQVKARAFSTFNGLSSGKLKECAGLIHS